MLVTVVYIATCVPMEAAFSQVSLPCTPVCAW